MPEDSLRERIDALEEQGEGSRLKFKARAQNGIQAVFKADDRFIIWGPASLEVVDKENDKITAKALESALPQLLRRARLSVEHSDQLVGKILKDFESEEPVTVKIDGEEHTRTEFPTGVLKLGDKEPGLYVAGEVWKDTRQAREMREMIENGEVTSYSISGESITDSVEYKDGELYDEISEMDLSAVTLCEDGMNPEANFGVVTKTLDDPTGASGSPQSVSKEQDMGSNDNPDDDGEENASNVSELSKDELSQEFKNAAEEVLDGKYASQEDVAELKSDLETLKEDMGGNTRFSPEDEEDEDEDEPEVDAPDESPDEEDEKADDFPEEDDEDEPEVDDEPDLPDEEEDEGDLGDEEEEPDLGDVPEEDEQPGESFTMEEIEEKAPDDLADALKEHLKEDTVNPEVDPDEDGEDADEEASIEDEVPDEEDPTEKAESVFDAPGDDPIEKAANYTLTESPESVYGHSKADEHVSEVAKEDDDDDSEEAGMSIGQRTIYKDDPNINTESDQ